MLRLLIALAPTLSRSLSVISTHNPLNIGAFGAEQEFASEVLVGQLPRRDVDVHDHEVVATVHEPATELQRPPHDDIFDVLIQAGQRDKGQEVAGRQHAACWMLPPDQRFVAHHVSILINNRLEPWCEFVAVNSESELFHQVASFGKRTG
jgi:hypothetical protein